MKLKEGDRITARHLNFDGRYNDPEAGIFEPDVDDPAEVLEGVLVITDDKSVWGTRRTLWVRQDNGALRQIEPGTAQMVGG